MRNTTLSFLFLLLGFSSAFAQSPEAPFKYAVKLSNQSTFDLSRIRDSNGNYLGGGRAQLFQPIPGFLLRTTKGNFLDFSLQGITCNLSGRTSNLPTNFRPYNVGLRFKAGYFFSFFKAKATKWVPALGVELLPGFSMGRSQVTQLIPTSVANTYTFLYSPYPTNTLNLSAQGFLSPRIMWFPAKRFFMDATLNMRLFSFSYYRTAESDPSAIDPVLNSTSDLLFQDRRVQLSIGLGLKL